MDSKTLQELKSYILQRQQTLKAQLPSVRASAQPVAPDPSLGRLTRMDAIQDKEMNDAALRQMEIELAGLAQALQRLDQPEFGHCEECEEPIPLGRLKVMPGTRVCVNCA